MGYYMGDYYAGSRGDPGVGSFFRGLLSSAASMVPGVGGAASRIISKVGGAATAGRSMVKAAGGVIMKHPVLSAAGAAGVVGLAAGGGAVSMMHPGGGGARGFHRCKSKHGCKHGEWVRNRHMNVCNPRALRRAIRRTHGFAKLAMRTIHIVHPKKKGRFGGFKKKTRK